MRPETMEKAIAVSGTAASCASLLATVAYLFGNALAVLPAAAGIIVTALCAGALAGIHIGRLMIPRGPVHVGAVVQDRGSTHHGPHGAIAEGHDAPLEW